MRRKTMGHRVCVHGLFMIHLLLSPCIHATLSDTFKFEITENSRPGTHVGKILTKPGFTYRFNDDSSEFQLDANTGVITTLIGNIDRETKAFYNLVVLSSSPTYPLEVEINVVDVNDNVPFWPSDINANLSFSESAPVGTRVILPNALDADTGELNYRLDYVSELSANSAYSSTNLLPLRLSYNTSTALLVLEVAHRLDREVQDAYVVNITATDPDGQAASILFNINVLDSNDNPPMFDHSDYSMSINESLPKGESVLQVRATDADQEGSDNSRLAYYLTNSEDFQIDAITGVIRTLHDGRIKCGRTNAEATRSSENDESWRVCVFTVFAHDFGVPRQDGRTYVTAKIIDSNNHSPTIKFRHFSKSEYATVDEAASNASVVAAISVTDLDHGRNGQTSLAIIKGNEAKHFRLESMGNSHIVRVNNVLDREKWPSYNLTLEAHDFGTPSRSSLAHLAIVVQDHNDHAPKFDREIYETTIVECENQINSYVYLVKASDDDEGINSQIYYSISGPDSHYFKIDTLSGLVTSEKTIDREQVDYFELRVTARDGGSSPKWAHAILKIRVLDVNDEVPSVQLPTKYTFNNISQQYEVQMVENNRLELNLIVHDGDLGANGTVELELLYDFDGLFEINTEALVLRSTRLLDYEQAREYDLVLRARDRGPAGHRLSRLVRVHLSLIDQDDCRPRLLGEHHHAVLSHQAITSLNHSVSIARLQLSDQDQATPVQFEIRSSSSTDGDLSTNYLHVTATGEIRLKSHDTRTMLRALPRQLTFGVDCVGCEPGHNTTLVNIHLVASQAVVDRVQRQYSFSVNENANVGSVVGELEAELEGFELFAIHGQQEEEFVLAQRRILTNKPLDCEKIDVYNLLVVAIRDDQFLQLQIEIQVVDVNDNRPRFVVPSCLLNVEDDIPLKYVLNTLAAIDADGNASTRYTLLDNPYDLFAISSDELYLNGLLSLVQNDDRLLRLRIRAEDAERVVDTDFDARNSQLTLFISISRSKYFKSRFTKKSVDLFISESVAINEQIYQLTIQNNDNEHVCFSITEGNTNDTFGIFPDGRIYLKNRLDREVKDTHLLKIELQPSKQLNASSEATIDAFRMVVHIKDANDNQPLFTSPTYRFQVPENMSENFFLGKVEATDDDSEANSRIVYSLVESYYSSFVDIDPETGYIWTIQEFDRETLQSFEVTVQASDQSIEEPRLSSQATVIVEILDINDNAPVFKLPAQVINSFNTQDGIISGEIKVSEAFEVGAALIQFEAIDLDFQSNVEYFLDMAEDDLFKLNKTSGELRLVNHLDREAKDAFEMIIEARDGKFTSFFKLKLSVEDVNDCEPYFVNVNQTEFQVPENISIGSEIVQFSVIDRDMGVNAQYTLTIDNYSGRVFDIINHKLTVVNNLDYEKVKVHHLNISLIETISGKVIDIKQIVVNLVDVNDCKPIFTQRTETEVVHVLENIDIGTKLITLQASDCDAHDELSYEIVSCNTHYHTHRNIYLKEHESQHKHDSNNCPLKLNTATGEIININNLDREVIESINLKLSVRDSANHQDRIKVIFIIEDINDELPMFVSPTKIILNQDQIVRPNSILGAVKAIDLDLGVNSALTYRLDQFDDYLEVDKFTGLIRTRRSLDQLFTYDLNVNLTAQDGGGLSTTDMIQFIHCPELPSFDPMEIKIDMYENEPIGSQVTRLTCREPPCQFHLVNATDRSFNVDTWTGIVGTIDLVDREMLEFRTLDVLVISENHLQNVGIHIRVLDQNDNPPYLTNTSLSVHLNETIPAGSVIFDFSKLIADEDTSNKFDYQIINCSTCDGAFNLNRKTGLMTLQSPLDAEKINKYRVLFGVSDGIYLLTSVMDIIVDDENDNVPYFKQSIYVFDIEENTSRGTVVGQVIAYDDDVVNRNFLYSIESDQDMSSFFSLDVRTGIFSLSKSLDFENDPSEYRFSIYASDGVHRSSMAKVIFNLINLADNPPMFEQSHYKLEVLENKILANVICLPALDADLEAAHKVECNQVDAHCGHEHVESGIYNLTYFADFSHAKSVAHHFGLDATTGCVSIVKSLDRESTTSIDVNIIASDGYFNATTRLSIKVMDENDNLPQFDKKTPHLLKLAENVALETLVHTFKAIDADEPPNSYVKYELATSTSMNQTSLPFVIGSIDGQLKVTGAIDRETIDHFDLIIRAIDYGNKSTNFSCRIDIIDLIDNSPTFEKQYYELQIYENITIGESIFLLDAKDRDETDEINYRIISGDAWGHFRIVDDQLQVALRLNHEDLKVYNLKINAIDKGGNMDTVNVHINVMNVFDERPIFVHSPFHVNWFENELGVLGKFEAIPESWLLASASRELDTTSAGQWHVSYLLINNYEDSFRLNTTTSLLCVVKPIDREALVASTRRSVIELKIIAIDNLSRMSDQAIIHVRIFDANDNAPRFEQQHARFELKENQLYEANTTLGYAKVNDDDEADVFQFQLKCKSEPKFGIDNSGRVFFLKDTMFDREQIARYEMIVEVNDGKHRVTSDLVVVINDVNDQSPRATKMNGLPLAYAQANVKLKMSYDQLRTFVERKFPLFGFEVIDGDEGNNGQVQFRIESDSLRNYLYLDDQTGVIKADPKILSSEATLSKLAKIEIILSDNGNDNRLSSSYSIRTELSNHRNFKEAKLVNEDFASFKVNESIDASEVLFRFHALQSISEMIIYAGDVYGHFTIIRNQLILLKKLDYESKQSYDLYIQAINRHKDFNEIQLIFLRIEVQNDNDNPPMFVQPLYRAQVPEEEDDHFVIKVLATDVDSPTTSIHYRLVGAENLPFRIDNKTGNIWTTEKIDREKHERFELTVVAQDEDGLKRECLVMVDIEDKNDNPPRFTRLFKANITENIALGTFVTQITSVDPDSEKYSNVTYSLLTPTDAFSIDAISGRVHVTAHLDREIQEEYFLIVSANDGSWKAQTTLMIYILDENDNSPRFDSDRIRFDLAVSAQLVNVGQVRAIDHDKSVNGVVNYRFKTRSKHFTIDPHTGVISVKQWPKLYSHEMAFLNHHFLTVVATDEGLFKRSSQVHVTIRLVWSEQTSTIKTIVIPEDFENGTLLYQSNSMINVSMCPIVCTHYNHLLFAGQGLVQAGHNYSIELDKHFDREAISLVVIESNSQRPLFVNEMNSTEVMEAELRGSHHVIEEFKAIDVDKSSYNNRVTYRYNITRLDWNANLPSYLFTIYGETHSPLFKRNLNERDILENIPELRGIENPFQLNETSGELMLRMALDFEVITRYVITITATDNAWYAKSSKFDYAIKVGNIDDYIDYNLIDSNSLQHASVKPDPMSIGVLLVVFFFLILILAISTSFFFYHSQKKTQDLQQQQHQHHSLPQRKLMTVSSFSPYVPVNPAASAAQVAHAQQQAQLHQQQQQQRILNNHQMASMLQSQHLHHGQGPAAQVTNHVSRAQSHNSMQVVRGAPTSQPPPPPTSSAAQLRLNTSLAASVMGKPPLRHNLGAAGAHVSRHSPHRGGVVDSIVSFNPNYAGSESASVVAGRMQAASSGGAGSNGGGATSSIYTHTNSETATNYMDNYSNILASAEHYDLENASSIAPSDIDIVYHYKGFRNRDTLHLQHPRQQQHAPLSRLSPSVSEVSATPRILTLQDLSPKVSSVPSGPVGRAVHHHKQQHANGQVVVPLAINSMNRAENGQGDQDGDEDHYDYSRFDDNYDLCQPKNNGKAQNVYKHVW